MHWGVEGATRGPCCDQLEPLSLCVCVCVCAPQPRATAHRGRTTGKSTQVASQFEEYIKAHGDEFEKGELDETGRSNDSVRGDRIRWLVGSELQQPCVGIRINTPPALSPSS